MQLYQKNILQTQTLCTRAFKSNKNEAMEEKYLWQAGTYLEKSKCHKHENAYIFFLSSLCSFQSIIMMW